DQHAQPGPDQPAVFQQKPGRPPPRRDGIPLGPAVSLLAALSDQILGQHLLQLRLAGCLAGLLLAGLPKGPGWFFLRPEGGIAGWGLTHGAPRKLRDRTNRRLSSPRNTHCFLDRLAQRFKRTVLVEISPGCAPGLLQRPVRPGRTQPPSRL